jgi:hypothetical protein
LAVFLLNFAPVFRTFPYDDAVLYSV